MWRIGSHRGSQTAWMPPAAYGRKKEKARRSGLPVVVEVRRLELLTPYMRSKCSTS